MNPSTPQAFIDYWSKAEANERANSQSFLIGLARILGVRQPASKQWRNVEPAIFGTKGPSMKNAREVSTRMNIRPRLVTLPTAA